MNVLYHRLFEKRYSKLPLSLQRKVDETISLFLIDPYTPRLRNHALLGILKGSRAISVTNDLRILYQMEGEHVTVLFLDVGRQGQVYK